MEIVRSNWLLKIFGRTNRICWWVGHVGHKRRRDTVSGVWTKSGFWTKQMKKWTYHSKIREKLLYNQMGRKFKSFFYDVLSLRYLLGSLWSLWTGIFIVQDNIQYLFVIVKYTCGVESKVCREEQVKELRGWALGEGPSVWIIESPWPWERAWHQNDGYDKGGSWCYSLGF